MFSLVKALSNLVKLSLVWLGGGGGGEVVIFCLYISSSSVNTRLYTET